MKNCIFIVVLFLMGCSRGVDHQLVSSSKKEVDSLLNLWHHHAAVSNLKGYMSLLDSNSTYIGTDATEIWSKSEFYSFCKPYFDKQTTWDFKTIKRNIKFNNDSTVAWFNELLDTKMGICRGSGTLLKTKNKWELQQYVLSATIPNENMNEVEKIKRLNDSIFKSVNH
jgi:hypothetical protein